MKRKRVYLKKKAMADLTGLRTDELLNEFDQYLVQQEVADIIAELKARVIKPNDPDGDEAHNRGVRPFHAPHV